MLKKLSNIRDQAKRVGWLWAIGHRILKRLNVKEVRVRVSNLKEPVYIRVENSDIYEYIQSLGFAQQEFELKHAPSVIIDAGANVGYASLRFLQKYPDSQIIALEPEPTNIEQFKKNCSKYKNVKLEEAALWLKTVNLKFKSLNVASNEFQVIEDDKGDIKGISMSDLMNKYSLSKVDLLKVDIEGSEKFLFSDLNIDSWLSNVNALLIEVHGENFGVSGCAEVVKKATARDFKFCGYINEYEYYENINTK